jgi:XisH protein
MAKDIYHDIVKRALQKDGWTITHDPYKIPLVNRTLKIVEWKEQWKKLKNIKK